MKFLRILWEDLKAARRGERRIAPRGARGRVYEKKDATGKASGYKIAAKATPVARIVPSRVWSDAEQRWYSVPEWLERQKQQGV